MNFDSLGGTHRINFNGPVRVQVGFPWSPTVIADKRKGLIVRKGDFHFVWECMRTVFAAVWGSERDKGSFCHLKDLCGSGHANKEVKLFLRVSNY